MQQKKKNLITQKDMFNRTTLQRTQKEEQSYHQTTVDTVVSYMNHRYVQHMARTVQGVAESILPNEYAGARAEKCQKITTENSTEQFTTHTNMVRKKKWL